MRLVRFFGTSIATFIIVLTPARGWCQRASASGTPDLVAAIIANYAAIADRDTSAVRGGLADDFRWVLATGGQVVTRSELIAAIARAPTGAAVTYGVDSAHVEIVGHVAMVEYRLTDRRRFGGYARTLVSRGTDTFVERDREWRLVRRTQTWIVAPPATITLDPTVLRAFVGRYEHGPGFVDDVHLVGGELVATSSAEAAAAMPGAHLRPVSDDAFSPDGIAPLIVFERDASGRVTGYVQQSPDGSVVRARRLPDAGDASHASPSPGRAPHPPQSPHPPR